METDRSVFFLLFVFLLLGGAVFLLIFGAAVGGIDLGREVTPSMADLTTHVSYDQVRLMVGLALTGGFGGVAAYLIASTDWSLPESLDEMDDRSYP